MRHCGGRVSRNGVCALTLHGLGGSRGQPPPCSQHTGRHHTLEGRGIRHTAPRLGRPPGAQLLRHSVSNLPPNAFLARAYPCRRVPCQRTSRKRQFHLGGGVAWIPRITGPPPPHPLDPAVGLSREALRWSGVPRFGGWGFVSRTSKPCAGACGVRGDPLGPLGSSSSQHRRTPEMVL